MNILVSTSTTSRLLGFLRYHLRRARFVNFGKKEPLYFKIRPPNFIKNNNAKKKKKSEILERLHTQWYLKRTQQGREVKNIFVKIRVPRKNNSHSHLDSSNKKSKIYSIIYSLFTLIIPSIVAVWLQFIKLTYLLCDIYHRFANLCTVDSFLLVLYLHYY